MRRVHTVVDSPLGPLTLVATNGVLSGLYMDRQRHRPDDASFGEVDAVPFGLAIAQLSEYFAGARTVFDVEVMLSGSPFQVRVWQALREIPCGQTVSYGQLARRLGDARASRAVGTANGRNPVGIIVPCHRVIGAGGGLTGYGGGVERKRWLLDWERQVTGQSLFLYGRAAAIRSSSPPVPPVVGFLTVVALSDTSGCWFRRCVGSVESGIHACS